MRNTHDSAGPNQLIERLSINNHTAGEHTEELWRDCLAPFFQVETRPRTSHAIDTSIDIYSLQTITCIDQQFNDATFIRDPKRIAYFDNDCIGLCLWLKGQNNVDNAGTIFSAKNSAFLMDMGRPVTAYASASRCLSLTLPKALLAQFGAAPNKLAGACLDNSDPRLSILMGTLRGLFTALPTIQQTQAETIAKTLGALVGGLFSHSEEAAVNPVVSNAAHQNIVDYIQRNLADPRLGIDLITKQLPYSRSSLYRQFLSEGGIAQYIRRERLKRCYRAIAQHKFSSISAIAQSWGFTNASHFSRLFKRHFGLSPQTLREQAHYQPDDCPSLHNFNGTVQKAIKWFSQI